MKKDYNPIRQIGKYAALATIAGATLFGSGCATNHGLGELTKLEKCWLPYIKENNLPYSTPGERQASITELRNRGPPIGTVRQGFNYVDRSSKENNREKSYHELMMDASEASRNTSIIFKNLGIHGH